METKIGIDKDKILRLSNKLREAWNDFFWEFRECQRHIRFEQEERSNYIADLFNYFDDTVHHLEKFNAQPDYLSSLYETVAVLQFMYIQQDLMDELLILFKIQKRNSEDKIFVRQLRNELIGHPISRVKGELISSVFITGYTQGSTLSYVRYHKNTNYKHDLKMLDWKEIFQRHESYLEFFLTTILNKVVEILAAFKKVLKKLQKDQPKMPFENLVKLVSQVFENYTENFPLTSVDNILHCYRLKDVHPRYSQAVYLFEDGLKDSLQHYLQQIDEFNVPKQPTNKDLPQIKVKFVSYSDDADMPEKPVKEKINYEFSKLGEKAHPMGLSHFLNEYQDDPEIMQELNNMVKCNGERDVEFYCSYEYLRLIFEQRGML